MSDTWDPDVYARFRAERDRPVDDLVAMLRPRPGGRVLDLGCGSGELTGRVHRAVGAAETIGIDSSSSMLAAAPAVDGVRFVEGDLATHADDDGFDLVFANASLQWVADHPSLFSQIWGLLRPGGQLAVQVPANFDHPSHVLADVLGQAEGLDPLSRTEAVLTPVEYATLLHDLGAHDEHVRLVVYGARLERTADVVEWVRGSLLTHYRRALGDAAYQRFETTYTTRLLAELGDPTGEAPYYFPFPRILMAAVRAG